MKHCLIKYLFLFVSIGFSNSNLFAQEMDELWGGDGKQKNQVVNPLFSEGNYAMFIHWGVYSDLGAKWKDTTYYGISEWIKNPRRANISTSDYKKAAKQFNPSEFDAKQVVALAKAAGMKYIVITSKHHDGFAMYDSDVNDFNIVDATAYGKDVMKQLAKECKKQGIGLGFYYSHNQDWTFPGGRGGPKVNEAGDSVGFDYYFYEKCLPQVEEITSNYGDIALVWFDTPGKMSKEDVQKLVNVVRKNQPNAMVSGRVGRGLGDYKSLGDMYIPKSNIENLWETVDVTNDSWGYAWYDQNWKTPKTILTNLLSTVARGGTYMLNVGPDGKGNIPVQAQQALKASGKWLDENSNVVQSAEPSPWGRAMAWGDVTVSKDGTINLLVYNWPQNGKLVLPGLKSKVKAARVLIDNQYSYLEFEQQDHWTTLSIPYKAPSNLVSIIELKVDNTLEIEKQIALDPYLPTTLTIEDAVVNNARVKEFRWMEKFGEWKHVYQADQLKANKSTVEFTVEIKEPGYYQTELNYRGEGRLVWRISNNEGHFVQNQQNASSTVFHYYPFGWLTFDTAGTHTITIQLIDGDQKSAKLNELKLTPIEQLN